MPPGTRTPQSPDNKTNDAGKMQIKSFPLGLGGTNNTIPYIAFKIYRTQSEGAADPDPYSAINSLKGGAGVVADNSGAIITAGTTAAGAAVGVGVAAARGTSVWKGLGKGSLLGLAIGGAAWGISEVTGSNPVTAVGGTITSILGNALGGAVGIENASKQFADQIKNFSVRRNQVNMDGMIAMFMPEGISTSYNHNWGEISITGAAGKLGLGLQALQSNHGAIDGQDPYIAEAAALAASAKFGEEAGKLVQFGMSGQVLNPQLELLYESPSLREFQFDFRLVPRNQAEADTLFGTNGGRNRDGIINMFKFYAAPKIPENVGGRYFIPPCQFEIEFYDPNNMNGTNEFLFKTKKCVLTGITVNYDGPGGYASFKGGAPVEVRLQLQFKETVLLSQDDFAPGSMTSGF
jgi:hypothetical protein